MKSLKLIIKGMHCEACEKNLKREIGKLNHVREINLSYKNENAEIFFNPEINENEVLNIIKSLGYTGYVKKEVIKSSFNNFINSIFSGKNIEGEMLFVFLKLLVVLTILEIIAYFGFFASIDNFFSKFGFYLIFLVLSVVLTTTSVWHIKAYGNSFSCMSGMMAGMTIGMLTGFLIGAIVGATNGIFVGSVIGIIAGMLIGSWCGNCTGIMGILEGMMAGLMGGLMGAMTSLMMINDNIKIIFPLLFGASALILLGLDYMVYKENKDLEISNNYKYNHFNLISFCFAITLALTFLMIYGPKSALFR